MAQHILVKLACCSGPCLMQIHRKLGVTKLQEREGKRAHPLRCLIPVTLPEEFCCQRACHAGHCPPGRMAMQMGVTECSAAASHCNESRSRACMIACKGANESISAPAVHKLGLLEALQVAGDGAQTEGVKAEGPAQQQVGLSSCIL